MQLSLFGTESQPLPQAVHPIKEFKNLQEAMKASDIDLDIETDELKRPRNFVFTLPPKGTPAARLFEKYRSLGPKVLWRLAPSVHTYTSEEEELIERVLQKNLEAVKKLLEDETDLEMFAYFHEEFSDVVAGVLDDVLRGETLWHEEVPKKDCCLRGREGVQDYTWNTVPRKVEYREITDEKTGKIIGETYSWDRPHSTGQRAIFDDKTGKIVGWEKSRGFEIKAA